MSESNGASRAVDRVVDAIRADEPPELDWDAMERSLMARVRRGEGARPALRPTSGAWQVLSFAAAAALVPLALSAGASAPQPAAAEQVRAVAVEQVAAAPGGVEARDLTALRSGDAIEAKAEAITFADAGNVRWTLSPGSRLVVRSPIQGEAGSSRPGAASKAAVAQTGMGHIVRLERGSVRVEVQPDLVKDGLVDVLAVEVGNTRVAVHGTVFTVTLRDGEVVVDVEHGVVTVGPTGQRGATTGYELPAGSRAAFSLDGGRSARWLPRDATAGQRIAAAMPRPPAATALPSEPAAARAAEPAETATDDVPAMMDPPPAASAKVATGPQSVDDTPYPDEAASPAPPPSTTAAPPKPVMSAGGVQSGLRRCFLQAHPPMSIDGPKLTASSTFTLQIKADGSVKGAQFNPPLPSIQGCAAFVWGASFAPAAADYTLSIPVNLSQ